MMNLLPRRNPPLATVPTKNILPNPQVTVEGARKSAQRHRPNPKLSAVSPTRLHLCLSKTRLTPRSQASSRPRSDSPPKDLHLWMRESTPKVICHHPEEAYSTETMTELARRLGKKLEEGVIPIGLKVYPLPRRKSDSH